jgi:hypothetical protein
MNILARLSLVCLMGCLPLFLSAQVQKDAQLWKGLVLQKTFLNNRLQFSLNEEVRLRNNFSEVRNSFTDLSLHYKLRKRLAIGLGYRYSIRPDVNVHRLYSDLTWRPKLKKSRFGIVLRTRLQQDRDRFDIETTLRPRLWVDYNLPKTKLEPYVAVEPFFRLQKAGNFDHYRLYAGVKYPLRKKVELRGGYIFAQDIDGVNREQDHIFMIRVTIDLDKDDGKEDNASEPMIGW